MCTAFTLGLGCYALGARSIWVDEGASIAIASQHGLALWHGMERDGGNLFLYYLVLHVIIDLFGDGVIAIRLFSVLAAAATVPATFFLARRLLGNRVGLFSAALVGVSYPLILWGQMARGYSLAVLLAVLSTHAFVEAIESGKRKAFVVYVLLATAMCYTLLFSIFVVGAQVASLLLRPRGSMRLKQLVCSGVTMAVLLIPLVELAMRRGKGQVAWISVPTAHSVRVVAGFLASSPGGKVPDPNARLLVLVSVIALGLAVILFPIERFMRSRDGAQWGHGLALLWLGIPPAASYVISRNFQPIFIGRYFTICLPAVAIALSVVLDRLHFAGIAWPACLLLCVLRFVQIPPSYGMSMDDWRGATRAVLAARAPGDCIAFYGNDGWVDFRYYLERERNVNSALVERRLPQAILPVQSWSSDPVIIDEYATLSAREIGSDSTHCNRVWLIGAHFGGQHRTIWEASNDRRFHMLRLHLAAAYPVEKVHRFPSISVYLFARPHLRHAVAFPSGTLR